MKKKPKAKKPKRKTAKKSTKRTPPDGRGERPTDPNEFAKWLVERTTESE